LQIGAKLLVLQPRDRTVLEKLALLRLLDRRQIEQFAGFHSVSRANVRLARLRHAGLIVRFFTATETGSRRSVYALTKRGTAEIQKPHVPIKWRPDSILLGNSFASHQLALSDIYIAAATGHEIRWRAFSAPPAPSIPIIPDAGVETSTQSFFVEMDMGTEQAKVWDRKVELYLKLAIFGAFREIVPHPQFAVLVVTDSEERMNFLRRVIAKQTPKLFWFQTLSTIKRQGFWSASWLRPEDSALSPPGG